MDPVIMVPGLGSDATLWARMGPGSRNPSGPAVQCRLHQQAEQKTAPDQHANQQIALASREPSTEGRQFAAWLGLTPLQNSSGGKERLGRISKMGDKYLRRLLVIGATSLVRYAKSKPATAHPHLVSLLARKPARVATVAMANKMARIIWAVMTRGVAYQADHLPALSVYGHKFS